MKPSIIEFAVAQQAAEWFALLNADRVDETARSDWQQWLGARPEHAQAWARVEAIGQQFDSLSAMPARQALKGAGRGRRRAIRMLAMASIGVSLGWAGSRSRPWQSWSADHGTAVGETRELLLADRTQVWLNTDTAVDVDYGPTLRRLVLRRGEVLVRTAADTVQPSRPWVVDTPQGRLRALGTHFSVRRLEDSTVVAVFEGAVEIRPASGAAPMVLPAGRQARFWDDRIEAAQPAELFRQAWARGVLVADDMRLGDFIAELSRHRPGHLGCDPAVADLRLVGAYPLADTDRVLAALEDTLPVSVQRTLPWWTVVRPR